MRGRRLAWLLSIVMLAPIGGLVLGHGPFEPPPLVLEGELLDLACFVAHGASGANNARCAESHTSPNQPLALLTDGGEIHLLYADHESAYPHDRCRELAGQRARLTGVPASARGLRVLGVRKVELLSDEAKETP